MAEKRLNPQVHKNVADTFPNRLRRLLEWPLGRFSLVGDFPVFDSAAFPWAGRLEENWLAIRRELDQVLSSGESIPNFQEISTVQAELSTDNLWKTYFLYGYGYRADDNCARCPETTRLVEQIPGMKTAFFSILGPGKHIPPHRGPYKGVLRCHLGLIVPEPRQRVRIRVDQEIAYWEEGRCLIFDDSFEHEVWNDTDQRRVVLFIDFARPMPFPLSLLNRLVIYLISLTPFVQEGRERLDKYNKKKITGPT